MEAPGVKDKLLTALRLALAGGADEVPSGWLTMRAMAKKWRMSEVNARRFVAAGLREGLLERKTFRIQHAHKIYPAPHFRQIPKPAGSRKPQ